MLTYTTKDGIKLHDANFTYDMQTDLIASPEEIRASKKMMGYYFGEQFAESEDRKHLALRVMHSTYIQKKGSFDVVTSDHAISEKMGMDDFPIPYYGEISAHDANAVCQALRDVLLTESFSLKTSPLYNEPGNYIAPLIADGVVKLNLTMVMNGLAAVRVFELRFKPHGNSIHLYAKHGGHNFLIDSNAYGILTALFGYQLAKRGVLFKLIDDVFIVTGGLGNLPTIFTKDKLVLTASKDVSKVGLLASLASAHYYLGGKRYLPVQEEVLNGKRYTYLREVADE